MSITQDRELTPKQESILSDLVDRWKRIHSEIVKSGGNISLDLENDESFDSPGNEESNRAVNVLHRNSNVYGIDDSMNSNEMYTSNSAMEGRGGMPNGHQNFDLPRYIDHAISLNGVSGISRSNTAQSNDISIMLRQNYEAALNLNNSINTLITQMHQQVRIHLVNCLRKSYVFLV